MTHIQSKIRVTGAALLVAVAACSSATSRGLPPPLTVEEKVRADSAMWPYTQADIDFMSGMIHHHAQAIVMARMAPTNDAGRDVRVLCERIINAQMDEIALMQQWLRDRNKPVPEPMYTRSHTGHGTQQHVHMAGMLSEEQLNQLEAARGKEFDQLFLRFMIQHHQGAVTMVSELLSARGAAIDETVFKMAADINVDQETEIRRMQGMLFNMLIDKQSQ